MNYQDDFQIEDQNNNFYGGLFVGTLLSAKQNNLRQNILKKSQQQFKQSTLDQKIKKINKKHQINHKEQQKIKLSQTIIMNKNQNNIVKKDNNQKIKTFEDLRIIKPILKAINQMQYIKPTPIQQLTIPTILSGKDIVASSITGSGKTAAFLIPIIQRYYNAMPVGYIRAMIVTPTRQLAIQIYEHFQLINKYTRLDAVLAIGASSISAQQQSLRNNPELVIVTPGRMIDLLINSKSIGLENLQILVFDQADKLLELGFQAQIQQIIKYVNPQVQTILFSATMGKDIKQLASLTTRKPVRISADPDNSTAERLHQQMIKLRNNDDNYREAVLISVLTNIYKEKVIIFFKTKKQCHRMAIIMGLLGYKVCQLHGNLSQSQRINAFLQFKQGEYNYMMATDLAARGLDIKQVKSVVNFELPTQLTRYIHRIGRTARAGNIGSSLTLCNDTECRQLKKMTRKTGDKLYKLNIEEIVVQNQLNSIGRLQKDISRIQFQERQQRAMRKAEMELQKLDNINEHQKQIYSRPKKTWFISQTQKRQIQQKAKDQAGVKSLPPKIKQIKKFHRRPTKKNNSKKR